MEGVAEVKEEPSWAEEEDEGGELEPPLGVYLKAEYCDDDRVAGADERSCSPGENEDEEDDDICHIQPDVLIHTPDVDPLHFPSAPSEPESESEAGRVAEKKISEAEVASTGEGDTGPREESKPSEDRAPGEELAFSCPGCPMSYSTLTYLKTHKKYCRKLKVPKRKSRSKSAQASKVTEPVRFTCPVCGRESRTGSNHKQHMLLHSGAKPHACPTCGASFARKADMNRHLLSHRGERPYACGLCGLRFIQSAHLTQHIRTHTGVRPHACDVCGVAFATKSNLTTHRKQLRGERCGVRRGARGRPPRTGGASRGAPTGRI